LRPRLKQAGVFPARVSRSARVDLKPRLTGEKST
jgi:hypothetical protein